MFCQINPVYKNGVRILNLSVDFKYVQFQSFIFFSNIFKFTYHNEFHLIHFNRLLTLFTLFPCFIYLFHLIILI